MGNYCAPTRSSTTESNEVLAPIHNRMPVMLNDPDALGLLKPYPAELMHGYDVSKRLNNPKYDAPDCTAPVEG